MVKKSTVKLAAAALTLALTLGSCGASEGAALPGYKEISNEDVSYDLFVPDEWIVDRADNYTLAHRSDSDTSNISVMAYELTSANNFESYEDYWKIYEPTRTSVFPDLEYIKEGESFTLDGIEAAEYVYTASMNHGLDADGNESIVPYKFQQIVAKKGSRVYILTFTAQTAAYDEASEEVAAIWSNFRFH